MVLSRIIDHLREQNWTAIAIDFVIVVAGVFVGIQASNLNEEWNARRLEQEYDQRLVDDLDAIIANARSHIDYEVNKSAQVRATLRLAAAPPSEANVAALGNALAAISGRRTPSFESPTFNDLQNSGRLSLVTDPALRRDLSAYFARLQYLRNAVQRNNDTLAEPFREWLRYEGIGADYSGLDDVAGVKMTDIEKDAVRVSIKRMGPRDPRATGSNLRLAKSSPFWERLRANLSWRGRASVANENLITKLLVETRSMKRKVEAAR